MAIDYRDMAGVTPEHPVNRSRDEARRALAQMGAMHPAVRAALNLIEHAIEGETKQLLVETEPSALYRHQGAANRLRELAREISAAASRRPAE